MIHLQGCIRRGWRRDRRCEETGCRFWVNPHPWRTRWHAAMRFVRHLLPEIIGVAIAVALLLLVGCQRSKDAVAPALLSAPIHATQPRRQHCMRPPPESPPMTGDEDIDRHRRDWHRERLIAAYALAYEACRP